MVAVTLRSELHFSRGVDPLVHVGANPFATTNLYLLEVKLSTII